MNIYWLELIAFAILFFVFKKVTNIKSGKLLALAMLFPFFLPFTYLSISSTTDPGFLKDYLNGLIHYLVHVGIGSVIGIAIEEIS